MSHSSLTSTLGQVDGGPAAVIVRHAERFDVPSIADSLKVGLTAKGREDARLFGRSLRTFREVRVFHSPAVRCRETAEAVIEGLTKNGASFIGPTETWSLCAPYLKDDRVLQEAERLGHGFMRAWHDGDFNEEWIERTPQAADMVLAPIVKGLREPGGAGRLDIHVSHDWEIALLREELLDLRHEEVGWVEYLDGMVFTAPGEDIIADFNGSKGRFRFDGFRRIA